MQTIQVTVPFKEGLHARPATELVKVCMQIKSDITIIKDDSHVNPKSILGIMSLGATYGSALTVQVEGADETEAIAKLEAFFKG
ncbi:MAG: HPr family phosphocarrier protein [Eubacteriales bacterium]|nr:HPr family phosphocarrier protein [Eubacteriales bacterium]